MAFALLVGRGHCRPGQVFESVSLGKAVMIIRRFHRSQTHGASFSSRFESLLFGVCCWREGEEPGRRGGGGRSGKSNRSGKSLSHLYVAAGCQEKPAILCSCVDVFFGFPFGVGRGEPCFFEREPCSFHIFYPSVSETGAAKLLHALSVAPEIFDERVISAQGASRKRYPERGKLL